MNLPYSICVDNKDSPTFFFVFHPSELAPDCSDHLWPRGVRARIAGSRHRLWGVQAHTARIHEWGGMNEIIFENPYPHQTRILDYFFRRKKDERKKDTRGRVSELCEISQGFWTRDMWGVKDLRCKSCCVG